MATTNFNLPTIEDTDKIDGVSAINGLANAVDTVLETISSESGSMDFPTDDELISYLTED
jgi:hypothetical protein